LLYSFVSLIGFLVRFSLVMVTVVARVRGNRISEKPSVTEYEIHVVDLSMSRAVHILFSRGLDNVHVV
jgi:hypothetical protein